MKTKDFNSIITSVKLAENLEKQFGVTVNVGDYDREQLEDIRNKLRTRIFQQEGSAKFNDLLTNETYQKNKAMLELLNTRIKEMLGEQMKQLRDKMDQLTEAKKTKGDGNLANNAKPYDKVTQGDVIAGRLGKDEKGGKKAGKAGKPFQEAAKKMCAKCKKPANMCKCAVEEGYELEEGFDDMEKAKDERHAAEKRAKGTGNFDKKTLTTGELNTRKAPKAEPAPKDTKVKKEKVGVEEGKKHPKDCDCKECMGVYERDEGKHNNGTTAGFKAVAKKAAKEYGSKTAGERVAGAVRNKMKKAGQLEESQFKHNVRFVNESIEFLLQEDEEAKAKTITAAGDIVNDFTGWMQRIGQYQTKAIIELADSIRSEFGAAESEAFKQKVSPALSTSLDTLTQQREALSNAVAELAGEAVPDTPMGMEPNTGMDAGLDQSAPDEMNSQPVGDEFAASDAAAGGDETAGRGLRESAQQRRARRLAEQHSILSKLAR
jgi:hypothetical protein